MWRQLVVSLFLLTGSAESAELSGRLVKKYYTAPSIVRNPPFGWFIELDTASQDYLYSLYHQIDPNNKSHYSDFSLNFVHLTALGEEAIEACHHLEGRFVSVQGKVNNPPHIYQTIPCYQLAIDALSELSFLTVEEKLEKTAITPESYGVDISNLSDAPLEFEGEHPESRVALRGKLILRLHPNSEYGSVEAGDNPTYCWFLQMDRASFQIASTTLLPGLALSLADIMSRPNWFEVQLGVASSDDFCCNHVNQEVVAEGYLFHAHTGHHHAPFLMDILRIHEKLLEILPPPLL